MNHVIDNVPESAWLANFNRRKTAFELGRVSQPAGPQCRRIEIPSIEWPGGRVDPLFLGLLFEIDPRYEVVYDRFTAKGIGPGHHLYYRISGDGKSSSDVLELRASFQEYFVIKEDRVVQRPWPKGTPKAPGTWFLPFLHAAIYHGQSRTAEQKSFEARERIKANKASKIKKVLDAETAIREEIAPYTDRHRTFQSYRYGMDGEKFNSGKKLIFDPSAK